MLTTINEAKSLIKDIQSQIEETPYPDEILNSLADSEVPIYYNEIIGEWTQLSLDDGNLWQELGIESIKDKTIEYLMTVSLTLYYQRLFSEAYDQLINDEELVRA